MMKSAEDWLRNDLANPLNGTTERRIFAEGEMCPDVITIVGIGSENPAQMGALNSGGARTVESSVERGSNYISIIVNYQRPNASVETMSCRRG